MTPHKRMEHLRKNIEDGDAVGDIYKSVQFRKLEMGSMIKIS